MGRYSKEDYKQNKERILNYQKIWKKENKDKINKQRREWYKKNKIIIELKSAKPEDIERNVKLYLEGKELDMSLRKLGPIFKERILIKTPLTLKKCKECFKEFTSTKSKLYCSKECSKKFFKKNFYQKYLKGIYQTHKKRMKTDYKYMIKTRLRDRLREAIRFYTHTGKIRNSEEYLDYKRIIKHLGPCPGDRKDYHIDHIIPLYNFDFSKEEEIIKAFAPKNLQWLSVKDNLKKGKY